MGKYIDIMESNFMGGFLLKDNAPGAFYVSFIIPSDGISGRLTNLHTLLADSFGGENVSCITEGVGDGDREVIYRISTPVIVTSMVWKDFFKILSNVFHITREYLPHFTTHEEVV